MDLIDQASRGEDVAHGLRLCGLGGQNVGNTLRSGECFGSSRLYPEYVPVAIGGIRAVRLPQSTGGVFALRLGEQLLDLRLLRLQLRRLQLSCMLRQHLAFGRLALAAFLHQPFAASGAASARA